MTDILGPASTNAVTSRPGRTNVRGVNDTWFQDCSSPTADDGTVYPADFFNDALAQLRTAFDGTGILEDNGDDMLLRAIQSIGIRYAVDTGAANHLTVSTTPPVRALSPGLLLLIKAGATQTNTGDCDVTPDAMPSKPLTWPDGTQIQANTILPGCMMIVGYDGVGKWELLTMLPHGGSATPVQTGGVTGKSLVFTAAPQTYLQRAVLVDGDRMHWTVSAFVRRLKQDLVTATGYMTQPWFSAGGAQAGSDYTGMYFCDNAFSHSENLMVLWWNSSYPPVSGIDLTDVSRGTFIPSFQDTNWHHFLMNADGTHINAYVDGILVSQGAISGNGAFWHAGRQHMIGTDADDLGQAYFSEVKMAEIHLLDGLALTPDKFAVHVGGVWVPKNPGQPYGGSYGAQGSYLNFADGSVADATHMGKDNSGNGNNWTPHGMTTGSVSTDYPG